MTHRNLAFVCLVLAAAATHPARVCGEPGGASGATTGNGSTPFTGLAHAPEANLFMGAATTAIPIEVPPGRNQMTPHLALNYSTTGGPSAYGYGWDLPLGKIQRSTKHGVPTCAGADGGGPFVLVLPQTTVECVLDPGDNRCRPLVEEAFLRIEFSAAENSWQVHDKSGIRFLFGDVAAARVPADPTCATFAWGLTHIEDPHRNAIDIAYVSDGTMLYPDTLRYGGHPADHLFEVNFIWSDEDGFRRPPGDEVVNSMGGFPAQLTRLLSRIEVGYPAGSGLLRWYGFTYEFQTAVPARLGRQSFLTAVTLYDRNNRALSRGDGLPASTTFAYHQTDGARLGFAATSQTPTRPVLPDFNDTLRWTDVDNHDTRREVLDMNGDGFPDLVDTSPLHDLGDECSWSTWGIVVGYWQVYLGSAAGFATTPTPWYVPSRSVMCHVRAASDTVVRMTTMDLTGDGIADFVDARTTPWRVYPGGSQVVGLAGISSWGFGPAEEWAAPLGLTQVTLTDLAMNDWRGSGVVQDLLDMNGDGLADLVRTDAPANSARWRFWPNTGHGFGAAQTLTGATNLLSFTTRHNNLLLGTFDVNGDGLPDAVRSQATETNYPGYWEVWLNTGHGLTRYERWGHQPAATYIRQRGTQANDIVRDFFDVNGDGLPDLVDARDWNRSGNWLVYLNRGAGWSDEGLAWPAPWPVIRDSSELGGRVLRDTFDVDGDGLVDAIDFSTAPYRVFHAADGAWTAAGNGVAEHPAAARADALVLMENGLGGTTALRYRPSTQWDNSDSTGTPHLPFVLWTLTHIEQDDGLCADDGSGCIAPGTHRRVVDLRYAYGMYAGEAREFRGFGTVEEQDATGTRRATWFHQDAVRAGKPFNARVYAASQAADQKLLAETAWRWDCADPGTGAAVECTEVLPPETRRWARLRESVSYEMTDYVPARFVYLRQTAWDAYGNVIRHVRGGNGIATLITDTTFARNDRTYVVDKPAHVTVRDNSRYVQEKWFFYDGHAAPGQVSQGALTTALTWLDRVVDPALPQGEPCPTLPAARTGTCLPTHLAYDAHGNLVETVDANGNVTTTRYDATNIYPATVIDVNGFQVATRYDAACGALRSETVRHAHTEDPATQPATTYQYDSFCRLQRVALPDESLLTPHARYFYFLGAPRQATDVLISSVEPWAPSRVVLRDALFDAFGRHLQTQRPAVIDGTAKMVAEGSVAYDTRSQIGQRFVPFLITQRFQRGAALYSPPPAGTGVTTVHYDALNRIIEVLAPDQSRRTMTYDVAGETTTRDECYLAPDCSGGMTVERRDVLGQLQDVQRFDESGALLARTAYTFDSLGHLQTTRQGDAAGLSAVTRIVHEYDSLGRKVSVEDPDSGRWRYGYDRTGNLLYQDDPKPNQHVEFCYDAGGRVLRKHSVGGGDAYRSIDCVAPGTANYMYDDPAVPYGIGRLTRVDDESGSTLWHAFDVRGHALVVEKRVRDLVGTVGSATTRFQYDTADHLMAITYPDDETVRYGYDAAGQVRSLRNTAATPTTYMANLTYDEFGRPRVLTHGNGTTDTRTYAGSGRNFRLASLTTRQPAGTTLLNLSYAAYTPTGLLTRISDLRDTSSVLSNTATFTYDGLGRLSAVTGSPVSNPVFAYDTLGNITRVHDTTVRYTDTLRPHRATSVSSWTGTSGAITHDGNGNRLGKPGHEYAYDPDDRLQSVRTGNAVVEFQYDHAGQLVLQTAGSSTTRYFNQWAEVRDGYLTKHYFAAGLRIASQQVWMPQLTSVALRGGMAAAATARPLPRGAEGGDLHTGAMFAVGLLATGLLVAPWRRQPVAGLAVRYGHVVGVILAFAVTTLPWQIVPGAPPLAASAQATPTIWHHHLDHLGSTQVITDAAGALLQQIRYTPYGAVRYRSGAAANRYEFAGYESEPSSGLQHAKSRFYDPVLGMFLTQDPAHQFPNPYTYAGWNPANLTDPDGEFVIELLAWAAVAAVVSAAVNSVIAAAQGASLRQIGEAAMSGATTGAVGVGLGVLAAGANIGLAGLAGTLPHDVTLRTAVNALGEVSQRAAFSTVVANAAAQTTGAAGAPPALSTGLAVAAGIGGSVAFDSYFIDYSGDLARVEGRGMFRRVSNTATHANVTTKAAEVAGFNEAEAGLILKHNLAQDLEIANNQHHFDFGAQGAFKRLAAVAVETKDIRYVGAASHYLQDQYALGHIFPGTHLLSATWGAPFRFVIHQTIGGEVNFFRLVSGLRIPSSFNASAEYLSSARDYLPSGTPL